MRKSRPACSLSSHHHPRCLGRRASTPSCVDPTLLSSRALQTSLSASTRHLACLSKPGVCPLVLPLVLPLFRHQCSPHHLLTCVLYSLTCTIMPPRTSSDDMPPSYQDALVHGIYMRTGKTPFPEAPRLNARCLELSGSTNLEFQKFKDASLSKPPVPREKPKPLPEVKKSVPKSTPCMLSSQRSKLMLNI